jgi:hypothetical protein
MIIRHPHILVESPQYPMVSGVRKVDLSRLKSVGFCGWRRRTKKTKSQHMFDLLVFVCRFFPQTGREKDFVFYLLFKKFKEQLLNVRGCCLDVCFFLFWGAKSAALQFYSTHVM